MPKKVVLLCPTSSQPRFHKRAKQLSLVSDIRVFSFQRGLYEENKFDDNIDFSSLGKIKDGKYILRIFSILKALFILKKAIPRENRGTFLFYTMSLDTLILAKLAGLKSGFYEIGDIRFSRSSLSIISILENFLIIRLMSLVLIILKKIVK